MQSKTQFKLTAVIPSSLAYTIEEWLLEASIIDWSFVKESPTQSYYTVEGYFTDSQEAQKQWSMLHQQFPDLPDHYDIHRLDSQDWQNAYKAYIKPWSSRNLHWIPLWVKDSYHYPKGEVAIYLDAGIAFGTGAHETTRLCAERLLDATAAYGDSLEQKSVVDAGCGSGILALSAAALGFPTVKGFDIDPDAVRTSQENAALNHLVGKVSFFQASLREGLAPQSADLVLANIQADILCACSEILIHSLKPKGTLVLSGILVQELAHVASVFHKVLEALSIPYTADSRQQGEWADLCFFFL